MNIRIYTLLSGPSFNTCYNACIMRTPISKQLSTIDGVSALTLEDEVFFRTVFPNDGVRYFQSWLYLLRACRVENGELGYKYVTSELVTTIGHRHGFLYVTLIFDATDGVRLKQLCDILVKVTGLQVILKKFQAHKLTNTIPSKQLVGNKAVEDDYTTETTLQLQKLFVTEEGALNPAAERLIRKANTFTRRGSKLEVVADIENVPFEKIDRFLARDKEKYASYISMVRYLKKQKAKPYNYKTLIFLRGGEVCCVYLAERLSLTELGLYCGVTSKDEPGLTEWTDVCFFRKMFLEGIQTVYLGGAEKQGVSEFVNKLLPGRPSYSLEAVLYAPASSADLAATIRPATEQDLPALAELYRLSYNSIHTLGEHWTAASAHRFIAHFYRRQPDLFFVAEFRHQLVGAAVTAVQPWWDGNHLVEGELFIDPAYRHKGVERKLLRALIAQARDTHKAIAWDTFMPTTEEHPFGSYEKIGFTEVPHWTALTGDTHKMLARLN